MNSGRHVLIVDDNKDDRELYSFFLQRKGFRVSEVTDGDEAVLVATELQPDLVLMDLWLPRMGGWETTTQLRGDPRTSHIPIIILSAHSYVQATSLGDGYLIKPCTPDDLLVEVQWVLERNRRQKSVARSPSPLAANGNPRRPPRSTDNPERTEPGFKDRI